MPARMTSFRIVRDFERAIYSDPANFSSMSAYISKATKAVYDSAVQNAPVGPDRRERRRRKGAYPLVPIKGGTYKARIKMTVRKGRNGRPIGRVRAGAPHSWLVEFGSKDRFTKTGAYRGRMPAMHVLKRALMENGIQGSVAPGPTITTEE